MPLWHESDVGRVEQEEAGEARVFARMEGGKVAGGEIGRGKNETI